MAQAGLQLRSAEAIFKANSFDPETIRKNYIAFAQKQADDLIKADLASPTYETSINNHVGPISSVVLPGPIVFRFNNWRSAVEVALAELQRRVPQGPAKGGHYRDAYVVLVNQQAVTDFSAIPSDAEVIIFNRMPYTRRLETDSSKWRTTRYFDAVKGTINRRFGRSFSAEVRFLNLSGIGVPGVPYILKTNGPLLAAKQNAKSSAFREGRSHLVHRKDRAAGQAISYPALVLNRL